MYIKTLLILGYLASLSALQKIKYSFISITFITISNLHSSPEVWEKNSISDASIKLGRYVVQT